MESKQILNVEQMKHLQELGMKLKETMMYWTNLHKEKQDWFMTGNPVGRLFADECLPAYTLQDVLDALPRFVTYQNRTYDLLINMEQYVMEYFRGSDIDTLVGVKFENTSLIDAAYSMLCWCIENGYINTGKEVKQ